MTPSDAGACCLMSCCRRMRVPAVRATCAAALSEVEAGIRARAAAASFPSSSAAVGLQCGQHEMRRAKASRECAKPGQHVRDRWTTDGHGARAQNSYSNVIGATGAKAADRSTKRLRAPGWCARTGGRVHLCQRTRTCACARESRTRVLRAHRRIGIGVLRLSVK